MSGGGEIMKNVAMILSGCGSNDGSNIYEVVLSILALEKQNISVNLFAPDKSSFDVINHISCNTESVNRNILVESARLGKEEVLNLVDMDLSKMDGLFIPGGYGIAKNFCTYNENGVNCTVDQDIEQVVLNFFERKKPIAALCIAPILLAKILSAKNINAKLTIGNDLDVANDIKQLGATHIECPVDDFVYDDQNNIFTTPTFMLGNDLVSISKGIENLVNSYKKSA